MLSGAGDAPDGGAPVDRDAQVAPEPSAPLAPLLPGFEPADPEAMPDVPGAEEVLRTGPVRKELRLPTTAELRPTGTAEPVPRARRPTLVAGTILLLVSLIGLAVLGSHPWVRDLEARLGISEVIAAGLPFVVIGLVARAAGVLDAVVLQEISPILRLGLGWLGFVVGFQFDVRLLDQLPRGTAPFVGLAAGIPFVAVVLSSALVLLGVEGFRPQAFVDPIFLRDALLLGTAGAMTARGLHAVTRAGAVSALDEVSRFSWVEEVAAMFGLLVVAAYFRPHGGSIAWQLPGTAWLFLTVGVGAITGVLGYVILRRPASNAESVLLLLGSITLAAGMASYLLISPVVVCCVAGMLLVNVPSGFRERTRETLQKLERPIYLLFLAVAGALWDFSDLRGWVLMVVFVGARLGGRFLGVYLGVRSAEGLDIPPSARRALAVAPMGPLAIAVVVNAQTLYPGGTIAQIVTAVIGGAFVTEVVVQLHARALRRATGAPVPTP